MVKSRNDFCYHFVGAQLERCDWLHDDHFRCKYPPSLQKTTMACLNKMIIRLTLTELCSSVPPAIWLDEDTNLPILRVHYLQVHILKSFTDNSSHSLEVATQPRAHRRTKHCTHTAYRTHFLIYDSTLLVTNFNTLEVTLMKIYLAFLRGK